MFGDISTSLSKGYKVVELCSSEVLEIKQTLKYL